MTATHLRRDRCPMCGAPSTRATPAVRSTPAAEDSAFDAHAAFVSGYGGRRAFFTYWRCGECRGLYCPVYFSEPALADLYGHQSENMADVPAAAREATHRGYFDVVRSYTSLEGDYLELGPDVGLFAGLCADHGRFGRFHLFEPNRDVHAALAARLAGRDARVSSEPFRRGSVGEASVATAVLIHVLDHLTDPALTLEGLRDALEPGGIVLIVTHNEASLVARTLGKRWPPYALQHPQLFSPRSLRRLLERCGFQVVRSTRAVNYFPVTHLVRAVFSVLGLDRWAPRVDHPLTVPVKLGNVVTIARKPLARTRSPNVGEPGATPEIAPHGGTGATPSRQT